MSNKTRYAIIVFSVLSPILSGFISGTIDPNMGETDGLGTVLFMIIGPPFVGIVGLVVSSAVSMFKVKNKNWSLAGYISSALLTCFLILK